MAKKFFFILVLAALLLTNALPVAADDPPCSDYSDLHDDVCVHVNPDVSEQKEDGSRDYPYNTREEGKAYAQSLPEGGVLVFIDNNGNVVSWEPVPPCYPAYGALLPRSTLYVLLAILALTLILVGWRLRRAHQLRG